MSILNLALLVLNAQTAAPAFEVPFKVTEDAMIVNATVNGANVSLMVDTGFSGYVMLKDGIDVGKPTGEQQLRDFVGKYTATTTDLTSLQIDGHPVTVHDARIIQQPMRNMSNSYNTHVDGILGLGALKQQVFQINFEHQTLRFFPAATSLVATPSKPGVVTSTLLPIGHSALQMSVETKSGQKLTMALDTGNAFYATTHRDVLERVGLWSPDAQPKYMRISGVSSGAVNSWSVLMKGMTIFGIPVDQAVWDIIELPSSAAESDGTVGFQFLRNFNISVDFSNRIVWLENFTGKFSPDVRGDVGMVAAFSPTLRRMSVLNVSPEGPADVAGVQVGDELISINGKDLERENYVQMRHLFEGPAGSTVNLAVSRGGNLMRFQLKRQVLVNAVNHG